MSDKKDPRKTFGAALAEAGEKNSRVMAISADSSSGSQMTMFKNKFPERHLEFGIMEPGITGICAGLATTGKIPVFATIAPFVTGRNFDQMKVDLGYMKQNVKVVGRCAGLSYYHLGPTHQSLEDVALMRSIPGMTILNPGDPVEITAATLAMVEHVGPVFMKIGSDPMPVLFDESNYKFQIGKGITMKEGRDITIIGTGTVLCRAVEAAEILEKEGVSVRLINIHTIKPLDNDLILKAAEETGKIVTVEEHYTNGGLGGAVAELLAQNCPAEMRMIGVDDEFGSNGPYDELIGLYGLLGPQIADTCRKFLAKGKCSCCGG
ncbi:MAG: transketolase C-terminal domain-containing protein [Spirochaetia bacterium]|jgi:transketolase|nr:transketolase C-terminal domain-containing protein [Spirochaetia bacterium]